MIIEFFPNLIYTKITAFFRHLCGDGDRLAGIHPGEDCLFKGIIIFRDTADTKGFQDDSIIVTTQQIENLSFDFRSQFQHKDTVIKTCVRFQILRSGTFFRIVTDDAAVTDNGKFREVHTVKCIKTSGALLTSAGSGNNFSVKYNADIAGKIVGSIQNTLEQIDLCIGIRIGHWFLGTGQYDWLYTVLDQIRQGGSSICHGVCSMKNDKPIVVVIIFHDCITDHQPLTWTHIGAVDVHKLKYFQMTDVFDSRYAGCKFFPCHSRCQSKIPLFGCNRTTGCYH